MINKKVNLRKLNIFIVSITGLILFYILYPNLNLFTSSDAERLVFIFSWLGIIELIYIIKSWRNLTGRYLTLYTLFIVFFFLFNYGQSLLWAIGIHTEGELGKTNLYYYLSVPTNSDILKTQLLVLISGLMIHFGATLLKKQVTNDENFHFSRLLPIDNKKQKILFDFVILLAPIVVISEYYFLIVNYQNAQIYGYTALYYNDDVSGANVIFKIFSRLFLPVLIGMLIGSGYRTNIVRLVYILFGIDVILSLLVGDRGGWIYSLILLIICHHYYYKKIRFKQTAIFTIMGVVLSYVSVAVVAVRNSGVSISKILNVINNSETNPIVGSIFNMGGTMKVTTVLTMNGWDIFPYGNTFLYGLLIAPTKDVINWLDLNYKSVGGWFSQEYLGISNGAGFSIVAEVLINFGPYLLPFFMIIFGIFIYWITNIEYRNPNTEPLKIIFCIITTAVTINISRNVFNYIAGEIFYTTVQFFVYYIIFRTFFTRKVKIKTKVRESYPL